MEFEWDEAKRAANLVKHQLDFGRGIAVFDGRPTVFYASSRGAEPRFVTIGQLDGSLVAAIWTQREGKIRLISLRRVRDAEKRQYRQRHGRGDTANGGEGG